MIDYLLSAFVFVLIGTVLVSPIATEINSAAATGGALANSSSWGPTVLKIIPGLYSMAVLGIVVALIYAIFSRAGIMQAGR